MRRIQVSNLQWAAGIFCATIGTLMLIAPHQFVFMHSSVMVDNLWAWGLLFILTGCGLVSVPVLLPAPALTAAVHLLAAALLYLMALSFLPSGAWIDALNDAALGLGLCLALLLPQTFHPTKVERDAHGYPLWADLFILTVAASALLNGLLMLILSPQNGRTPVYNLSPASFVSFGIGFILAGLLLILTQLPDLAAHPWVRARRPWLLRGAHLCASVLFLAFLVRGPLPKQIWVSSVYYGGMGLILLFKPWLSPRMRSAVPRSMESRMVLILALTASMPLILTISWITNQEEASVVQEALNHQQSQAAVLAESVNDYISLYRSTLDTLANEPGLFNLPPQSQAAHLSLYQKAYPNVTAFSIFDASGHPIASTDPLVQSMSFIEYPNIDTLSLNNELHTLVRYSASQDQAFFGFSHPIISADGKFAGMITMGLPAEQINHLLASNIRSASTRVILVDENGQALSHPDANNNLVDLSQRGSVKSLASDPNAQGALIFTLPIGQQVAGWARVSSTGWGVVVERPLESVLAGVYYGRDLVFGLLLLFLVATGLLGIYLSGRLVSPLHVLSQAAAELAEGHKQAPLPRSGFVEVDSLARSFGEMRQRLAERTLEREIALEALRGTNEALERRVAERTAELQIANQELSDLLAENRQQRYLLERLVREAPVGIALVNVADNRITLVNPAYESLAPGRKPLVGRTIGEVWPDLIDQIQPYLQSVIETGVTFSAVDMSFQMENNGHKEEVYFSFSYSPLFDQNGHIESLLVLLRNTTEQVHMRNQIEAERARMAAIIEAAPEGIVVADAQGRVLLANPASERLYARPVPFEQEINSHAGMGLCYPDGRPYEPADLPLTRSAWYGEVCVNREMQLRWPDGQFRSLLANTAPILDRSGRITGAVGLFQDITERQHMEAEILRQRSLLQTIFEATPGGLALVVQEDDQTRIELANPAYRALTPHPETDPTGQAFDAVWPQAEGFLGLRLVEPALQGHKSIILNRVERQYGDHLKRYFSLNAKPMEWGRLPAALLVVWETTLQEEAQRRAETAAAEAKQRAAEAEEANRRLNRVLSSITDAYFRLDQGLCFTAINPVAEQKVFHRPASGLLARSIFEQFPAFQGSPLDQRLQQALHERQPGHFELQIPGQKSWFEIHLYPLENGLEAYLRDITERKQIELALREYAARLERSNSDLEDFAFIASHDLQEPLRKVQAFGDRLKVRYESDLNTEARDWIGRMQNAATRMSTMLNDLLAYSRVNTRARPIKKVDLNQLAQEVLVDLEIRLERSGGQVEVGELPTLEADPSQMRQLLQNLIINGLKFHKPDQKPVVRVSARAEPDETITLLVVDDGIGFDMAQVNRIFQPFQRLHGRSEYEGNGMGLAICRKIAERHQGDIRAESQPGQGCAFIVRLPLYQPQN